MFLGQIGELSCAVPRFVDQLVFCPSVELSIRALEASHQRRAGNRQIRLHIPFLLKDDQEHDGISLQPCMHVENPPRGLAWFSLESHRTHILRNIRIRSKHLSRWGLPTSDPLNWP